MSEHEPDVTPEQEARLRRLLADARHGEPIPVDVVARLDHMLVRLGEESPHRLDPDDDTSDPVADLAARRRRIAAGLLVAAAVVVVAGVGIGRGLESSGGDDSAGAASSRDASSAQERGSGARGPEAFAQKVGPLPAPTQDQRLNGPGLPAAGSAAPITAPVRLTTAGFPHQVEHVRIRLGRAGPKEVSPPRSFVCARGRWGRGRFVPAHYVGAPAILAFRPVVGATQVVDLLRCGSGEILRSTTLSTR